MKWWFERFCLLRMLITLGAPSFVLLHAALTLQRILTTFSGLSLRLKNNSYLHIPCTLRCFRFCQKEGIHHRMIPLPWRNMMVAGNHMIHLIIARTSLAATVISVWMLNSFGNFSYCTALGTCSMGTESIRWRDWLRFVRASRKERNG